MTEISANFAHRNVTEEDEEVNNMGDSHHNGNVIRRVAMDTSIVHRGDGEDEEGAIRRVSDASLISSRT